MWNPIFGWTVDVEVEVEDDGGDGDSVRASDRPRDFIVWTIKSAA